MTRKHPAGGGIAGWREHAPGDSVSTLKFRQLLTNEANSPAHWRLESTLSASRPSSAVSNPAGPGAGRAGPRRPVDRE